MMFSTGVQEIPDISFPAFVIKLSINVSKFIELRFIKCDLCIELLFAIIKNIFHLMLCIFFRCNGTVFPGHMIG